MLRPYVSEPQSNNKSSTIVSIDKIVVSFIVGFPGSRRISFNLVLSPELCCFYLSESVFDQP